MTRLVSLSFFTSLFVLPVLIGVGACSSPLAPDPVTVTLAPGAEVRYGRLGVTFAGVTADSRCPATALCIQQGDADVAVDLTIDNATTRHTLRINDPDRRDAVQAGHRIRLDTLEPYPFTTTPIPPADYRATFTVSRE
jgi:hypothetical protein